MTPRIFRRIPRAVLVPLLLLAFVTAGCEDSVNPFVEGDRYFTLYGFLDTAADTQFVRVVALRKTLAYDSEASIDASVTTTELQTGRRIAWRDSLIRYPNGRFGHVFYAPFHPVPGRTYRLDVTRSDGKTTRAETKVPVVPNVTVQAPTISNPIGYTQRVQWEGIDFQPFGIEVWYRLGPAAPRLPFRDIVIHYPPAEMRDGKLTVNVKLTTDVEKVIKAKDSPEALSQVPLLGIGLRLSMPDSAWRPPGGVFDPELLVQPGVFTNVENGFGFFGSANRYTVEWTLSPTVTRNLGYAYPN